LSTPIVVGLVMLMLGLVIGVGAGRFVGHGSVLAKSGQAAREAFLDHRLCIGGRLSLCGTTGQERIEHFSGSVCHNTKWPSFWAGPSLLNIGAIGMECSRVLQPVRIQRKPKIEHYHGYERKHVGILADLFCGA
jgi:hypothetical protein